MTEIVEDQLLIMKPHLVKLVKYRLTSETKCLGSETFYGKIKLSSTSDKLIYYTIILSSDTKNELSLTSFKKLNQKSSDSITTYASMNQEWRTMFAAHFNPTASI